MAMQKVDTVIIDTKKHQGRPLIGFYIGSTSYVDPTYGNTQFIHTFQKETGERVSIYGYKTLDIRMAKVPVGVLCQVTYLGTEPVQTKKFGLKNVHQAEVLMDVDKRIEVEPVPETEHAAPQAPAAKLPDAPPAKGKAGAATKQTAKAPVVDDEDVPF